MKTKDRQGVEWILWAGGDCPVTGPVVAIGQSGNIHKVDHAKYLHWPRYRVSEFNIVAYRVPTSTANANDIGLPCLREQQYDRECC